MKYLIEVTTSGEFEQYFTALRERGLFGTMRSRGREDLDNHDGGMHFTG